MSTVENARVKRTKATDLATWRIMLQDLGNPHPRPKVVQVAVRPSNVLETYQLSKPAVSKSWLLCL